MVQFPSLGKGVLIRGILNPKKNSNSFRDFLAGSCRTLQERARPVGTKLTQRCSVSVPTAQKETPPRLAPGTASNRMEKHLAFKR